ncbi:hypothetical protein GQ44DRAFT_688704 [Phaeosphaeriaceae sp. PMI808]|nr:hypothetical protein GQ44DRAFT_688704 [Phaeosphaeriaceae sp. PMI808]
MGDEMETPAQPRASRFKEHTNTTNSIHPPPSELWQDLGIEDMIEKFNEESRAPPTRKGASKSVTSPEAFGAPSASGAGMLASAAPVTSATSEGTFGRFSRAFASVFGGFGSVLGKRKAGHADAERDGEKQLLDERKQAADQAYQARKLAMEQGLLPTPKVFVRPNVTPRPHKCVVEHTVTAAAPRTPSLYKSPSRKDLHKQKKLTKRVSDLEFKLASARKELHTVLHKDLPPVPPLPIIVPPAQTPETSQSTTVFTENEEAVSQDTQDTQITQDTQDTKATTTPPSPTSPLTSFPQPPRQVGKIVKKRKATSSSDSLYIPTTTDSDSEPDTSAPPSSPERTPKRPKSSAGRKPKRQPSKLSRRKARSEEPVRIVPDGKSVPLLPPIPRGVEGRIVRVGDDGFGGLGHEIF